MRVKLKRQRPIIGNLLLKPLLLAALLTAAMYLLCLAQAAQTIKIDSITSNEPAFIPLAANSAPIEFANLPHPPSNAYDPLSQTLPAHEIYQKRHAACALIRIREKNEVINFGSGFNIHPQGLIATNRHLLAQGQRLEVEFPGIGIFTHVSIMGISNYGHDIALLKIHDAHNLPFINIRDLDVAVGERVFVISNPKGLVHSFTDGLVSGIRMHGKKRYYQITAPISPGSSGGVVLNASGDAIGIVSSSMEEGQGLNFCVPIKELSALLQLPGETSLDDFLKLSHNAL